MGTIKQTSSRWKRQLTRLSPKLTTTSSSPSCSFTSSSNTSGSASGSAASPIITSVLRCLTAHTLTTWPRTQRFAGLQISLTSPPSSCTRGGRPSNSGSCSNALQCLVLRLDFFDQEPTCGGEKPGMKLNSCENPAAKGDSFSPV